MQNLKIAIVGGLLLSCLNAYGNDWIKIQMDSVFSVEFPSEPIYDNHSKSHFYRHISDSLTYVAHVFDYSGDENFYLGINDLEDFYNLILDGLVKEHQGELINKSHYQINSLIGMEIRFKSALDPTGKVEIVERLIFINDKNYSFQVEVHVPELSLTDFEDEINHFFGSAELNENAEFIQFSGSEKFNTILEKGIENFIVKSLLVLALISVIFLTIRRFRKRNRKS